MKRKGVNIGATTESYSIQSAVIRAIEEDRSIENMSFELDVLENMAGKMLDFVGCVFNKVQFSDLNLQRVHFLNCRFDQCDLSGLPFRDGTLNRVEFVGCRGTGCAFDRMKIKDVLFQECQMNYLTLAACRMERTEFIGCDLTHAMLFESEQKDTTFEQCRLISAEVQSTSLRNIDLSSCELDGIGIQPESLRGATISLMQAPLIMNIFGVKVKV